MIPLFSVSAMRNWPSSGPRMNSTMLSMPKFGGDLADEAHRDRDVLGLRLVLDLLEALHRHLPRQLEVGARRRPEPEHELPRIDLGEQLGADLHPQQPEDQAARPEIDRHGQPAQPDEPAHRLAINLECPVEQPRFPLAMPMRPLVLEQTHAQDRYERAGEQVRPDHGESDRQRQRHEQGPERVSHDECRDEYGQDTQQRQQDRHGGGVVAVQHGPGDTRRDSASARVRSR